MIPSPARSVGPLLLVAGFAVGCASSPSADGGGAEPEATGEQEEDTALPPPGYGTLRQDDFTIGFRAGDVQIKITPLAESVIRLAAPDTYQRLHALVDTRRDRVDLVARRNGLSREPTLFLVSFFTHQRQAGFAPTDLHVLSQGMLYRPMEMVALTPGWGREQLMQEETQSALYVFDPEINLDVDLRIEYGDARTAEWNRIIRVLEAERGRVVSRAKS